jgi:glutamate-1-semialdehyde 2,1-aminomutase
VVVSDKGGPQELMIDGVTGFKVNRGRDRAARGDGRCWTRRCAPAWASAAREFCGAEPHRRSVLGDPRREAYRRRAKREPQGGERRTRWSSHRTAESPPRTSWSTTAIPADEGPDRSMIDATGWWALRPRGALYLGHQGLPARLQLSRAKHPSLRGHARMARRMAPLVPFYEYDDASGSAPTALPPRCSAAARRLRAPRRTTRDEGADHARAERTARRHLRPRVRRPLPGAVPVPQSRARELPLGCLAAETADPTVRDLDGNWSLDVTGAYGVNLFGYEVYKALHRARRRARPRARPGARPLPPGDRRQRAAAAGDLRLDEVSFHMSGTEAVMQAVRLARYHTGRSHVVRFCGAYHGWWDGVQAGVGNPRPAHEVYTLTRPVGESLRCCDAPRHRLRAGQSAAGAAPERQRTERLDAGQRRAPCATTVPTSPGCSVARGLHERGIVLIFDEVFLGFRLAPAVRRSTSACAPTSSPTARRSAADCRSASSAAAHAWMRRFRDEPPDRHLLRARHVQLASVRDDGDERVPAAISTARGGARRTYATSTRAGTPRAGPQRRLAARAAGARRNMTSIWTTLYTQPGRYSWMFQFYLRAEGIAMSWVGSGRLIFSHDFTDADFAEFATASSSRPRRCRPTAGGGRPPTLTRRGSGGACCARRWRPVRPQARRDSRRPARGGAEPQRARARGRPLTRAAAARASRSSGRVALPRSRWYGALASRCARRGTGR